MKPFQWGPDYFTYLESVDDQHYRLVELINELGTKISEKQIDSDYLDNLVNRLTEYVYYHFREEERIMAQFELDARHVVRHKEIHRTFVKNTELIYANAQLDNREVAQNFFRFLVQWLSEHILKQDKIMASQIQSIKSGISPKDAYDREDCDCSSVNATQPLIDSLNILYNELKQKSNQLKELNISLEKEVAIRGKELATANSYLKKISATDRLTQLPNRFFAMQTLERLCEESKDRGHLISCLVIDINEFRLVNQRFDYTSGDRVLCEIAHLLRDKLASNNILCRFEGDKFILLCPNTPASRAVQIAESIVREITKLEVPINETSWHGSVCIGVASGIPSKRTCQALLKRAESSLYKAKLEGKMSIKYEE